jgi:hypothetical protein
MLNLLADSSSSKLVNLPNVASTSEDAKFNKDILYFSVSTLERTSVIFKGSNCHDQTSKLNLEAAMSGSATHCVHQSLSRRSRSSLKGSSDGPVE